jgi:uncharacterized damage-inducible protein DinB
VTDSPLQALLVSSFDYYAQRTVARLTDLTDDEYFWEPVAGCWSVRGDDEGGWRSDWAWPPPEPEPVTTIAWRMTHLAYCLREHGLRPIAFGSGPGTWGAPTVVPGSAAAARELLVSAIAAWRSDLRSVDDTRLWEPLGPDAGGYATSPVAAFVEHIHDEFIHHSAEVALLRDLYRARPFG